MMLPTCHECYTEIGPMIMIGIAYSVYAAVLWACVPYVVEPRTIGTAFGIVTAV